MFNLEQAISDWRRKLSAAGMRSRDIVDELESHLREEIDRQIQAGATEQDAFQTAVAELGDAGALKSEFAKLNAARVRPRFLRIGYALFGAGVFLVNTWTLLAYELSPLERTSGFAVVALLSLYLACLPDLLKRLPAAAALRFAKGFKLASIVLLLWPLWELLEAEEVVHSGMGIVARVVLWCCYGALAMTGVAFGLHGRCRRPADPGAPPSALQPSWQPIPPAPPHPPEFALPLPPSKPVDPVLLQSFEAARAEADRWGHDFIGTEHVLLGLLDLAKGSFAGSLRSMNLDRGTVRAEIERLVASAPAHVATATLPFTPRARKAVKLAAREAKTLKHCSLGVEHIFLGLLLEGSGVAALVLRKLGVTVEQARQALSREASTPRPC